MLNGPKQRRRRGGVVDDQRQPVFMGNGGEFFDIGDIERRLRVDIGDAGAKLVGTLPDML